MFTALLKYLAIVNRERNQIHGKSSGMGVLIPHLKLYSFRKMRLLKSCKINRLQKQFTEPAMPLNVCLTEKADSVSVSPLAVQTWPLCYSSLICVQLFHNFT